MTDLLLFTNACIYTMQHDIRCKAAFPAREFTGNLLGVVMRMLIDMYTFMKGRFRGWLKSELIPPGSRSRCVEQAVVCRHRNHDSIMPQKRFMVEHAGKHYIVNIEPKDGSVISLVGWTYKGLPPSFLTDLTTSSCLAQILQASLSSKSLRLSTWGALLRILNIPHLRAHCSYFSVNEATRRLIAKNALTATTVPWNASTIARCFGSFD